MFGYVSAFDGVTLVDGTSKLAASFDFASVEVSTKIKRLPNGTIVRYDGTDDSDMLPGNTQSVTVYCKNSYKTFVEQMHGKIGDYGVLTFTKLSGGTVTCNAVLTDVKDATPILTARNRGRVRMTWQLVSLWS